jgi:hypothetical protein
MKIFDAKIIQMREMNSCPAGNYIGKKDRIPSLNKCNCC